MSDQLAGRVPVIWNGFEPWFAAFCELSSERPYDMAPVPYSAILGYADMMEWYAETDAFCLCVRAMDSAFLEWAKTDPDKRRTISKDPLSPETLAHIFGGNGA